MAGAATTRMEGGAFVIARRFDAPRDLVWRAWTEEAQLKQWFGPQGCTMPHARMDFRLGGFFHYGLEMANGVKVWGLWAFREIVAPERLVAIQSFSDDSGAIARHPWDPNWPMQLLSETSFAELDGGTLVTVRWQPFEASEEERRAFEAGFDSMTGGWGGTLDRFAAYLATTA